MNTYEQIAFFALTFAIGGFLTGLLFVRRGYRRGKAHASPPYFYAGHFRSPEKFGLFWLWAGMWPQQIAYLIGYYRQKRRLMIADTDPKLQEPWQKDIIQRLRNLPELKDKEDDAR